MKEFNNWNIDKKRSVGLFTDLHLYIEALNEMKIYRTFEKSQIQENLSKKVKGLIYSGSITPKMVDELFREMLYFKWISRNKKIFQLTELGSDVFNTLSKTDLINYRKEIVSYLHNTFIIPGWFVNRLWELNPNRQGEIIMPAPIKLWAPNSRKWENNNWSNELENVTKSTLAECNKICPGALPIESEDWITNVKKIWDRLSLVYPRRKGGTGNNNELMEKYQPRRRLSNAMKEATINILFNRDANMSITNPLSFRTFMVWCPRLAELELLWYSDSFLNIPGRLLFPTSVFKENNESEAFEKINNIRDPENRSLYLHRWSNSAEAFLQALHGVYEKNYLHKRIMYVSILDVRDEFCRKYRISAQRFETLLGNNLRSKSYAIALETDVREDQTSGSQQLRRPVIINDKFYSLIAITEKDKE